MATEFQPDRPIPFSSLNALNGVDGLKVEPNGPGWLLVSLTGGNFLHAYCQHGNTIFTRYGHNRVESVLRRLESLLDVRIGPEHEREDEDRPGDNHGKTMINTVRTSISVPVDLKARMEAHEPPVNWSAVACKAFAAIVDRDQPAGPDRDMTIVHPAGTGYGVRLLDREDVIDLQRNIDAGCIVAVFRDATGENVAYVDCTDAVWLRYAVASIPAEIPRHPE